MDRDKEAYVRACHFSRVVAAPSYKLVCVQLYSANKEEEEEDNDDSEDNEEKAEEVKNEDRSKHEGRSRRRS